MKIYTRVKHLSDAQLYEPPYWKSMFVWNLIVERLLVLPTNVRLGLKFLAGTNTVAYCENSQIMDKKVL
jgi:hypothetical protein